LYFYKHVILIIISRETLEEIIKSHLVDYEGHEFMVFEVAALKEADQYGKTHTAYINKKVPALKGSGKKKKDPKK